jgi:uncharacterized protein (TIGR02145 family)
MTYIKTKVKTALLHTITIILIKTIIYSCDKQSLPPVARLSVFPPAGDTSIVFNLSAAGTSDDHDYEIGLMYRWDYEGDGIWDTEFSRSNAIAHKYNESGTFGARVEAKDLDGLTGVATDTIELFRMNTDIDTLEDPRDGQRYRIVKIHGQWWMAENLRYGVEISTDREQTDNDTIEMYRNPFGPYQDTIGGVYRWFEAMNYQTTNPQGICPAGWHIPAATEWESLFTPYTKTYLFQYYRKNGHSNLNLDLHSMGTQGSDHFAWTMIDEYYGGGFWSLTFKWSQEYWRVFPYICHFSSPVMAVEIGFSNYEDSEKRTYLSVRCIKNNTD